MAQEAKVKIGADVRKARREIKQIGGDLGKLKYIATNATRALRARAAGDMDAYTKATRRADMATRSLIASMGARFKSGIAAIGAAAFRAAKQGFFLLSAAMTVTGVKAIKLSADWEQNTIAFTTMLGSAKKAAKFLKQMESFAAKTPFEFTEVTTSAKRMLALGWNAKKVIPTLRTIGNVVAAMGGGTDTLDGIVTALSQMQMKGKASAEEMQQLAERGVNGWDYIAKAIGKTKGETMKLASEGKIAADVAVDAILKGINADSRFKGMMQKQSQSLTGLWSNAKDAFNSLLRVVGDFLVKELRIKERLQGIADWFNRLRALAEKKGWEAAFKQMAPWVLKARDIAVKLWGGLTRIWAALSKVGSALKPLWGPFKKLAGLTFDVLIGSIEKIAGAIAWVIEKAQAAYNALRDLLNVQGEVNSRGGATGGKGYPGGGKNIGPTSSLVPTASAVSSLAAPSALTIPIYLDGREIAAYTVDLMAGNARRLARGMA